MHAVRMSGTSAHFEGEIIMIFRPREEGQCLIEGAIAILLTAVVTIIILALLGPSVGNVFSNITNTI
jgi:pilus assembly protein Flp/PilA